MTLHQFFMLIVMCAVIILLRAFPFIVFSGASRRSPALLLYLGRVMTAAAIAMLVVYSLMSICDFVNPQYGRLLLMSPAVLVTILLQCFLRNSLVSIVGGTVIYMILLQTVG